jgi:vacuolar-type H+-ATPase subunit E/Vma4
MSEDRALLIESLWRDAQREADEIFSRAREEGETLVSRAREAADLALREARERGRAGAIPEAARIRNRGLRQASAALLLRQQEILDRLFDELGKQVAEGRLPEKDLANALPPLLDELLAGVPRETGGDLKVRPTDGRRCRALLKEQGYAFTVHEDPATHGGCHLALAGSCGETRDNTLPSRLAALRANPPLSLFPLIFSLETTASQG